VAEDALSRVRGVVDDIAAMHGARVEAYQVRPGAWVAEMATDDWSVVAEGSSEAQAFSNLIKNAKAEGRAT
jgi:hypothetical protein